MFFIYNLNSWCYWLKQFDKNLFEFGFITRLFNPFYSINGKFIPVNFCSFVTRIKPSYITINFSKGMNVINFFYLYSYNL